MKKLIFISSILMASLVSNAQSLEDIIAMNLKARGGSDKILGLKTMVMECISNRQGMEFPVTLSFAHNHGFRLDMQIMGKDCFMLINTKAAYNYFPIRGQTHPETMPEEVHKEMMSRLDLQGDFIGYKEKGVKFKLLPDDKVEENLCYVLMSTGADGKEKTIYIDKITNLVIKEITKSEVEGEETEIASTYADFKSVDGYMVPMSISSPMNGDMKVTKYVINPELKSEMFVVKN